MDSLPSESADPTVWCRALSDVTLPPESAFSGLDVNGPMNKEENKILLTLIYLGLVCSSARSSV